jgi:hypothetical protein
LTLKGGAVTATVGDSLPDREETAYNQALRDAVKAVEAEWTDDPSWDGTNWNNALSVAKEVIEALGVKQ